MQPLVTCICPTTEARAAWLSKAIECFKDQTYENRELLIVTDHAGHLGEGVDVRVRIVVAPAGIRLGAKRNFANENARGEIIAHMDDDDWSAPNRLAFQVERLQATGKALTGLSRMKFTDGKNWWRYVGDPNFPLGTSLCYRKGWWEKNGFPANQQIGSDTTLIYAARAQKQVDVVECGDLMYARVHDSNTNKRSYAPPSFEPAEAMCFA